MMVLILVLTLIIAVYIGSAVISYKLLQIESANSGLGKRYAQHERGTNLLMACMLAVLVGPISIFITWCMAGLPTPKLPKIRFRKPKPEPKLLQWGIATPFRNATPQEILAAQAARNVANDPMYQIRQSENARAMSEDELRDWQIRNYKPMQWRDTV